MLKELVGHVAGVCVTQPATFRGLCVFSVLFLAPTKVIAKVTFYSAHLQAPGPEQVASLPPLVRWTQQANSPACPHIKAAVRPCGPAFQVRAVSLCTPR